MANRGRARARAATIVVAALLWGTVLAIGIDALRSGGFDSWLVARGIRAPYDPGPTYVPLGRLIDVDGRSIYLDCRGSGSPTVIFEAGLGGGADGWGPVFDGAAALTRTCVWERPGLGRSTSRGLHSGTETVADLRAALAGAGERGPYVVIAHSFGGVYARLFAAADPEVRRLIMLDVYDPDLGLADDPSLPAETRAVIRRSIVDQGASVQVVEQLDWLALLAELPRPTTTEALILSDNPRNSFDNADPAVTQAMVDAWYRAIARLYPNGKLEVLTNAGHFIHLDQPALVLERLRTVLDEVRGT